MLLLIGCYQFVQQRLSIYEYEPGRSYEYDFGRTTASRFPLKMVNSKLELPALPAAGDTALLKVKVRPALSGYWFQPAIIASSKDQAVQHTFEHGASGFRYLNVSRLLDTKPAQLTLQPHDLAWADADVELMVFNQSQVQAARVLVISPHPDDAELAAFGLYSNHDSYVVTVTAGESGKNTYNEIYTDAKSGHIQKGKLRVWDSLFVPSLGKVPPERTVNLGYFDGTLAQMYSRPKAVISTDTGITDSGFFRAQNVSPLLLRPGPVAADWASLVDDLAYIIDKIKPDIIVASHPGLDRNLDHRYAGIALFAALKKLNIKTGQLYLYTNHNLYNDFYPYGESGEPVSLPPHFAKAPYFKSLYSYPLSQDTQQQKLFALEAMHDLRLDTEWLSTPGALKVFGNNLKKYLSGYDKSYFRRAVRDNELFFVVPVSDLYDEPVLEALQPAGPFQ